MGILKRKTSESASVPAIYSDTGSVTYEHRHVGLRSYLSREFSQSIIVITADDEFFQRI